MQEWRDLIVEAKNQGITKEELLIWFESMKDRINRRDEIGIKTV